MKYLAFLLSAATAFAAVDGTVLNRTTGKPQPGATVTLFRLAAGMEPAESVKSDAQGRFVIKQAPQGPALLQTAFEGITYNFQLPPGASPNNLQLEVYSSSRQPGQARVAQHIVLFEPTGERLHVSETYFFRNDGNTTFNDPDGGTLRFFLPEAAGGDVRVTATAPMGMPVQRAAEKTRQADVYKIDFPIRPGDTRVDLTWSMPFSTPGTFSGRVFYKDAPTRLVVPEGVTLRGENLKPLGHEPSTHAEIFELLSASYTVEIDGAGSLHAAMGGDDQEEAGARIQQILPRVYDRLSLVLASAFVALGLGFVLLYRKGNGTAAAAKGARRR